MTPLLGCAGEPTADVDPAEYRAALAAVCTDVGLARSSLLEPSTRADVPAFASDVAALLDDEAERVRGLVAPRELDGDHRAFVQNTADQAARWRTLSTTSVDDTDAFAALQTEILQLSLGRDDLSAEMGVDACRRSAP